MKVKMTGDQICRTRSRKIFQLFSFFLHLLNKAGGGRRVDAGIIFFSVISFYMPIQASDTFLAILALDSQWFSFMHFCNVHPKVTANISFVVTWRAWMSFQIQMHIINMSFQGPTRTEYSFAFWAGVLGDNFSGRTTLKLQIKYICI